MEIEVGEPTHYPQQLVHSPFGVDQMKKIEGVINNIDFPSDT
jgi:hypothetical protein